MFWKNNNTFLNSTATATKTTLPQKIPHKKHTPTNPKTPFLLSPMKKITFLLSLCFSASLFAQEPAVKPVHAPKVSYFSLRDVQLLDGASKESDFKYIQEMTHRYLLTLEPDRLCSWFRREAGLTPKAKPYPGWESNQGYVIPGHILGFYLSSMAMMFETTGDPEIIKRLEYTLQQLDECQNAGEDGYIGAVVNGRVVYEEVLTGDYKVGGGSFAGRNEPTYIMNKITLGLYDVTTKCNLPLAKKVLIRFTDWFGKNIVDKLDEPALQRLLICEHGSLSESYINVYRLTGDKKYIEWAKRLNDLRILNPLSEGKDILAGWHANCQIQKNPGFESVYRYTGIPKYTNAARFFWKTVAADHTWVFGGNSTTEHFFPKTEFDKRVQQNGGAEACNSVNMLRLTEALYEDYAEPEKIDFYERVLVNHLLGVYEPERGMVAYMTKVQPGGFKTHSTEYDSFWCCTGTGLESPAKFQKMIYAYDDNALHVNLFIPSTLHWKNKGLKLTQKTKIPDEEQTVLELQLDRPQELTLKIRHPYWVKAGKMKISINGETIETENDVPSQFVAIKRQWKSGDKVVVQLPMHLTIAPLTPSGKFVSFSYGPVVLAAEYNSSDLKKSDFWDKNDNWGRRGNVVQQIAPERIFKLTGSLNEITKKTKKDSASPLRFKVAGTPYTLIPFNRIHFSRHIVYFPRDNSETSQRSVVKKVQSPRRVDTGSAYKVSEEIVRRTLDRVVLADDKSEKQHKIESFNSFKGLNFGETWRHALKGGYFMYEMKCLPDTPLELYFLFDGRDTGARTFALQIDGKTITTFDHSKAVSEVLYPFTVPIPLELTKGKTTITVKLQARRGHTAGGILDLRVLKKQ
ncbi:MAG: glycoside hydrolase family 127 protein [Puniceicoccales bacterium]|nr:glycoside hydrolase family 127 protein [Puniceicoccales bacterium]